MTDRRSKKIRSDLRKTYDKYAAERDTAGREDWKMEERALFLKRLEGEGKKRMLELGAGTGIDGKYFQDNGLQMTCIDLSASMVELCCRKGLDTHQMDMTEIGFPAGSFEAVYSMNSLLHLPKSEFRGVLRKVAELLEPGGLFYLGMYGGMEKEGIWEDDKYRPKRFFSFFTDEMLEEEVRQVFDLLSLKCITYDETSPLHFQSLLMRK